MSALPAITSAPSGKDSGYVQVYTKPATSALNLTLWTNVTNSAQSEDFATPTTAGTINTTPNAQIADVEFRGMTIVLGGFTPASTADKKEHKLAMIGPYSKPLKAPSILSIHTGLSAVNALNKSYAFSLASPTTGTQTKTVLRQYDLVGTGPPKDFPIDAKPSSPLAAYFRAAVSERNLNVSQALSVIYIGNDNVFREVFVPETGTPTQTWTIGVKSPRADTGLAVVNYKAIAHLYYVNTDNKLVQMTRTINTNVDWKEGSPPTAGEDVALGSQLTAFYSGTGDFIQIYYYGKSGDRNVVMHAYDSVSK